MTEVELTAVFIRNGESNINSGEPKTPDYRLTAEGRERARCVGRYLRAILGCQPNEVPRAVKYVSDGTNRAQETLALATSIAGLPGQLRQEPLLDHNEDKHADVRERVERYLRQQREHMQWFLDGWEVDQVTQRALSGLYVVISTSHQTIGAIVAPHVGITDEKIDSEHPLPTGGLSKPCPTIPFGSVTEVLVRPDSFEVVHAGLSPEAAAEWARGKNLAPPSMRRQQFGVPVDRPPAGTRYAGSIPTQEPW